MKITSLTCLPLLLPFLGLSQLFPTFLSSPSLSPPRATAIPPPKYGPFSSSLLPPRCHCLPPPPIWSFLLLSPSPPPHPPLPAFAAAKGNDDSKERRLYTYLHEAFASHGGVPGPVAQRHHRHPCGRAIGSAHVRQLHRAAVLPGLRARAQAAVKLLAIARSSVSRARGRSQKRNVLFLTWVNCRRVQWATTVQDALALTKVLALIIIIVAGMHHLARGHTENFENELPRAIAISLSCVTLIYILTNVAYFAVLSPEEILASEAVACPSASASWAWWRGSSRSSCVFDGGSMNGNIFGLLASIFVGARRGHLPRALGLVCPSRAARPSRHSSSWWAALSLRWSSRTPALG
ncbi:Large neutral amino acids transporter small subunit 2 [Penaeus vannamei]|uniref:Large neutral amino acids transporter small subunit 2 n=1 Tax=Penaeus vannamei TaxID=6689 RepID=A0A3R7SWG2_PENVA|nr:Large neutral amino acids transporter small subunit 2 [Penaeus vannamei]